MTGGLDQARIIGLGARVHIFVRPRARAEFTHLFRDVLGCDVKELDFGLAHPILLVAFRDGSAFSVEFTELAPAEPVEAVVDDENAFHGAWIEFRTEDVAAVQRQLREVGIPEFRHVGSSHSYFSAPGGQVFRILDINYKGP